MNIARMLPAAWLEQPRSNVWLGTSVEDQVRAALRIPHLVRVPAVLHFLSCEPLLGPVDLEPWLG
jgi:protein gp37